MEVVQLKDNKEKFEKAYDRYANQIYRIAFVYTQDQFTAQDIVQEVFLIYWKKNKSFVNEEHEKAWFIRITINQCHDHYRKNKNIVVSDEVDKSVPNYKLSNLYEYLSLLPKKNRSVIILHYLEGYSLKEIAAMLHCSLSAVKMNISRGKEKLKKYIGDYRDEL